VVRLTAMLRGRRMTPESWRVFQLALDAARRDESDDLAAEALAARLEDVPERDIQLARARLEGGGDRKRASYLRERACRLFEAAVTHQKVKPLPSGVAELFEYEKHLGRMSMRDAYRELSLLEPGLAALEETVGRWTSPDRGSTAADELAHHHFQREIRREAARLVGAGAQSDDARLQSNMALGIAQRYLYSLLGDVRLGGPETAYFSAPNILRSTSSLGGSLHE
jgi:hypothetical protein